VKAPFAKQAWNKHS